MKTKQLTTGSLHNNYSTAILKFVLQLYKNFSRYIFIPFKFFISLRIKLYKSRYENYYTTNLCLSIFLLIVGVFLLPNSVALASDITPENLIKLTNEERIKHNLSPLSLNDKLKEAATNKATHLLEGQYFAHTSPEGRTFSMWIKEVDYKFVYAGENLAMDFMTAEGVVKAWMKSESHKKNILNPFYNEIAISNQLGEFEGRPTIMVAQLFGRQPEREEKLTLLNFNGIIDNDTKEIMLPSIFSYNEGQIVYLNEDNSIEKISLATLGGYSPSKKAIKIVNRPLSPKVAGESTLTNPIISSTFIKNISIYFSLLLMFLTAVLSSFVVNSIYKYNYPMINSYK